MISPIGAPDSETRKRADRAMKFVFKPALEPLGYEIIRADHISAPGLITQQILQHVLDDDLVVADLTEHNPNVFYELAVRHAAAKPVIHTIDPKDKIPFDVAGFRTVEFSLDLEGAEEAVVAIQAQVKEIEAGNSGETPVKLAATLRNLGSQGSSENASLKQLLEMVAGLGTQMENMASRIEQRYAQTYFYAGQPQVTVRSNEFPSLADEFARRIREDDYKLLRDKIEIQLREGEAALQKARKIDKPPKTTK